jgi:DNA-directed RNA polymerase specialized sigma24 family protein
MIMRSDDSIGELVDRYRDGSPEDREELFARISSLIQPTIQNCVHRYYAQLKSSERWKYKEEDEVVLETYEHIVEQGIIDRYEGRDGASFQTYIYGTAQRYLMGEIRKGESLKEGGGESFVSFTSLEDKSIDEESGATSLGGMGSDERSREEIARALRGCIEGLSVRERVLIALFYYYREPSWGRDMRDIDVLQILEIVNPPLIGREQPLRSVEGVSTNRSRAVLRIKKCLEKGKFFERFDEILQLI